MAPNDDLLVIIVSTNDAAWLGPCLRSIDAHRGSCRVSISVVCNGDDGSAELLEHEHPTVRVIRCENRGFAHANNQGLREVHARYVLFLNPDTEVRDGTFEELIRVLDKRPSVGLAGVRQVTAGGVVFPTIRRFPNALRALGNALGSERLGVRASWLGERETDPAVYEREVECDWTSGSFMLARSEAIHSAGFLDERFFLFSEEADLCLRMRKAGWQVRHMPQMTILHHADKAGFDPRLESQRVFSRRLYARKHFSPIHRGFFVLALLLGSAARALGVGGPSADQQQAERAAVRTLLGLDEPPFGSPPDHAVTGETTG